MDCGGLVPKLCLTLATPWTVAHKAPLFSGFPRQEYWSGLPFPSPGDLPDPGIKSMSPALQANSLPLSHQRSSWCADHNKLWKILKEMEIPDHLTCLLRNPYVGQEATVRTEHGTTDWFKIGKGIWQGCMLYLKSVQSTSCWMPGWMTYKLEWRLRGEITASQIFRWYHPNGRKQRGTKEPFDEGERGEWKKLA